jgi:hypothetical protein
LSLQFLGLHDEMLFSNLALIRASAWLEDQLQYAAIVGRSDVIKLVKYIILGDQKAMHPISKMSCQQHFRSTRCLPATKRGRFLLEMTVGHPQVEVQSLVINN